jgi:Fusaric acid resistance protein family
VGALIAQPWRQAMFVPMAGNFVPLLAPANQQSYDTVQFYNGALAIVTGSGSAALWFRLLPPLSPTLRTLSRRSSTGAPTSELLCQFGGLLFSDIDHVDRAAIPRMFERKRHDFPDTDESQPEFDIPAQILEPGLRNRLKSSLVALPANKRDKRLLDLE